MAIKGQSKIDFPLPKNLIYVLFYSFINPKTWTFYGPWGMCAKRTEYWLFMLGWLIYLLCGFIPIAPVAWVVVMLFLVFAFKNGMHRRVPFTPRSRRMARFFWVVGLLYIGAIIAKRIDDNTEWLESPEQLEAGIAFLWFLISLFFLVGFSFLISRRAHDIGWRGRWWVLLSLILWYVHKFLGLDSEFVQLQILEGAVAVLLIIVLGVWPSRTVQDGNPFAVPLTSSQNMGHFQYGMGFCGAIEHFWSKFSVYTPGMQGQWLPEARFKKKQLVPQVQSSQDAYHTWNSWGQKNFCGGHSASGVLNKAPSVDQEPWRLALPSGMEYPIQAPWQSAPPQT